MYDMQVQQTDRQHRQLIMLLDFAQNSLVVSYQSLMALLVWLWPPVNGLVVTAAASSGVLS